MPPPSSGRLRTRKSSSVPSSSSESVENANLTSAAHPRRRGQSGRFTVAIAPRCGRYLSASTRVSNATGTRRVSSNCWIEPEFGLKPLPVSAPHAVTSLINGLLGNLNRLPIGGFVSTTARSAMGMYNISIICTRLRSCVTHFFGCRRNSLPRFPVRPELSAHLI